MVNVNVESTPSWLFTQILSPLQLNELPAKGYLLSRGVSAYSRIGAIWLL